MGDFSSTPKLHQGLTRDEIKLLTVARECIPLVRSFKKGDRVATTKELKFAALYLCTLSLNAGQRISAAFDFKIAADHFGLKELLLRREIDSGLMSSSERLIGYLGDLSVQLAKRIVTEVTSGEIELLSKAFLKEVYQNAGVPSALVKPSSPTASEISTALASQPLPPPPRQTSSPPVAAALTQGNERAKSIYLKEIQEALLQLETGGINSLLRMQVFWIMFGTLGSSPTGMKSQLNAPSAHWATLVVERTIYAPNLARGKAFWDADAELIAIQDRCKEKFGLKTNFDILQFKEQ